MSFTFIVSSPPLVICFLFLYDDIQDYALNAHFIFENPHLSKVMSQVMTERNMTETINVIIYTDLTR